MSALFTHVPSHGVAGAAAGPSGPRPSGSPGPGYTGPVDARQAAGRPLLRAGSRLPHAVLMQAAPGKPEAARPRRGPQGGGPADSPQQADSLGRRNVGAAAQPVWFGQHPLIA